MVVVFIIVTMVNLHPGRNVSIPDQIHKFVDFHVLAMYINAMIAIYIYAVFQKAAFVY